MKSTAPAHPSHDQPSSLSLTANGESAEMPEKGLYAWITLIALGTGLGFRIWQYTLDRALWLDEAKLAVGIVRPWSTLLEPLPMQQTAPLGFVALVKSTTAILGTSEWTLRLWPFVFGVLSLALFALLARELLPHRFATLAIALFAVAPIGIYYSAELKQYSADVFWTVLLTLLVLRMSERVRPLVVAGIMAPWFSHAALFVLLGLGGWIAWTHRRLLVPGVWAASCIAALLVVKWTTNPSTTDYMRQYWVSGLVPHDASIPYYILFLLAESFDALGSSRVALVGSLLAAGGCVAMGRRCLVLMLPVLVVMMAAIAHAYPFGDPVTFARYPERVILFLLPAMCLFATAGISAISRRAPYVGVAIASYMLVTMLFWATVRIPDVREDIRPLLSIIAENRANDDSLYLGGYSSSVFAFYGPRYGLDNMPAQVDQRSDAERQSSEAPKVIPASRTWIVLARHRRSVVDRLLNDLGPSARLVATANRSALILVD